MEILNRPSPPGIVIRRCHAILAVQPGKHQLPRIAIRRPQRSFSYRYRQSIPEPLYDPENFLRRLPIVSYLHTQRPAPRNRPDKKPRRNIRRDPDLARLQHDVPSRASPRILRLRSVQLEVHFPGLRPASQQALDQLILDCQLLLAAHLWLTVPYHRAIQHAPSHSSSPKSVFTYPSAVLRAYVSCVPSVVKILVAAVHPCKIPAANRCGQDCYFFNLTSYFCNLRVATS